MRTEKEIREKIKSRWEARFSKGYIHGFLKALEWVLEESELMEENCWTCKHGIKKDAFWCYRISTYGKIIPYPDWFCDDWEEAEG